MEKNNPRPLVSILLLSYRNIDGIFETLDSVFMQDYSNIEIVISDDGTPGFYARISEIERYLAEGNRGNICRCIINPIEENGGTVRNANSAIRKSSGAYVKTISPEDKFSRRDSISKYVEFMEQNNYMVCFAKMRGLDDEGNFHYRLSSCDFDYEKLAVLSPEQTLNRLYGRNFLPGAAEFFNRKVFEEFGLFPECIRLIEDYSYWLILARNNVKFGYIDDVLVDYRLSGVSSSGHYGQLFMEDMFEIYDRFIFPFDNRFRFLQPVYNGLKKAGLNYYFALANWEALSRAERLWARVKYAPFRLYTLCFQR